MVEVGVPLPLTEYCDRCREGEAVCEEVPDMTPGGSPAMATVFGRAGQSGLEDLVDC